MPLPLLAPLSDLLRTQAGDAAERAATLSATVVFALVATSLLVASGLVALSNSVGFPAAALVFAAIFGLLALAVHRMGRVLSARRAARAAAARNRIEAEIELAATLARSARPLLPVAAFLAAFVLMRRP